MPIQKRGPESPKWRPRALCACGCGERVKKPHHTYFSLACVPSSARSLGGRLGRERYAFKRRTQRYRTEIDRIFGDSRSISRTQLLELCEEIYRRGFQSGFAARSSRERRAAGMAA